MKTIKNRKAYYEYAILSEFNAGIVLFGGEVKSIRLNNVNITDSYSYISNGEIWIKNIKVNRYKQMHKAENHDENRDKKLLLHKKEIEKITKLMQENGTTIIPLEIFCLNNKIKIKIGIARGKRLWNKKEDIRKKDIERQIKYDYKLNI